MPTLIEEKQRKDGSVKDFIEKLYNLSLRCPEGMPLLMLLQIYRYNLLAKIEPKWVQSEPIYRKNYKSRLKSLRNQSRGCQLKTKTSNRQRLWQRILSSPNFKGRM